MAFRYNNPAQREPEFREVFRNRYVTGFSIGALLGTLFCLIFGLIFSAILLFLIGYTALALLYVIFGLDLLDLKSEIPVERPSTGSTIGGIIAFLIAFLAWLGFFAYLGPHNLIVVKRRFFSRLYVLAGRPLAIVEGKPTFNPDSESGYAGIEVGEFYFNFDNCWLDVEDEDLEKLRRAGGEMRIWYIPAEIRIWNNPTTGKVVKYNCILVRAEWRPSV